DICLLCSLCHPISRPPPIPTLFPYTTLFRSQDVLSPLPSHPFGKGRVGKSIADRLAEGRLVGRLAELRPYRPAGSARRQRIAGRPVMTDEGHLAAGLPRPADQRACALGYDVSVMDRRIETAVEHARLQVDDDERGCGGGSGVW